MMKPAMGNQFRYPLRITQRVPYGSGTSFKVTDFSQLWTIVFEYWERQQMFDCIACREAGNEWIGSDPEQHGRDHQMGFDYALTVQAKLNTPKETTCPMKP